MEIVIKVNSTYNNTIVSALYKGKILKTISTGSLGFKKAKRASTLAAQTCGEALGSWLLLLSKSLTRNPAKLSLIQSVKSEEKETGLSKAEMQSKLEYSLLLEAKKKLTSVKQNQSKVGSKTGSKKGVKGPLSKGSDNIKLNVDSQKQDMNTFSSVGNGTDLCNNTSLLIAGVGYGKFGVIRGLSKLGIKVKTISDVTAIPHNGCKPPKMRRK